VGFLDLDVLRHVNNGVYLSLGDVGRMDLMLRSGLWAKLKRDMPFAVVAAETIQFSKALNLFQRFRIETRVLGWDDRLFYLQQRFLRGEQPVATAVVALRFLRRAGGTANPQEVLATAGEQLTSPPLPEWVSAWSASMRTLRQA
jgi:acyl-CoA thioesterase FadM